MNRYQVYYRGVLVTSNITNIKAQAVAFQLCKDKGWDLNLVEIKDSLIKGDK